MSFNIGMNYFRDSFATDKTPSNLSQIPLKAHISADFSTWSKMTNSEQTRERSICHFWEHESISSHINICHQPISYEICIVGVGKHDRKHYIRFTQEKTNHLVIQGSKK